MNWIAFGKVIASHGTSPGPASGITYTVQYNDPETRAPVEVGPLRPWNPLEYDPSGNEIEVYALQPEAPMLAVSVEGLLQFIAMGPAEPRSYFECGTGGTGNNFQPLRFGPDQKPIVTPPPPPPTGGGNSVVSAPDGGGLGEGGSE